ncbi:MAG: M13 family peptidase, partial [Sphingomonadales bacterium]|nr:M13 family peptidase [Sphingomonadales bacterium]
MLAASGLALALAGPAPAFAQAAGGSAPAAPAANPTPEIGDWGTAGLQTQWMDRSIRPGDDFFRYVNGKWVDQFTIPADRTAWGSFHQLRALSEDRVRKILDDLAASKPAPGSDEARVLAAYAAFMDQDAIEAAGLAPARPSLDKIAAASSPEALLALFAAPGMPSPFDAYVDADPKQ